MPDNFDDMRRSLPKAYREDEWVTALLDAVSKLDTAQRETAEETARQMFLPSMTWVLDIEERVAGLHPAADAGLDDRRAALAAKWRSATGKCDIALIRNICAAWSGGEVEATYHADGLTITFVGHNGVPTLSAQTALQQALRDVIPAHLAVNYRCRQGVSGTVYTSIAAAIHSRFMAGGMT